MPRLARRSDNAHSALANSVKRLAEDIGRLRRLIRPEPGSHVEYLLDRLGGHAETFDAIVNMTAGELVAHVYPDDAETIEAALEHVDDHVRRLRATLNCGELA